jgi:hypothetical protein
MFNYQIKEIKNFINFYEELPLRFNNVKNISIYKNNVEYYKILQQIIYIYKNMIIMQYSVPLFNYDILLKYNPDCIIFDKDLNLIKTTKFKFRTLMKPYTTSNLGYFYFFNNYKKLDEINISFLYENIYLEQRIVHTLSNKIKKTNIYDDLDIIKKDKNLNEIIYDYNKFSFKNNFKINNI